jgi:hypothetical protein
MNQIAVREPDEIIVPRFSLMPTSMTEAMQLAELMATAKLVPLALQKSPADCLLVIMQAVRWDMDPFAVAQECSVIQGKIMYSGKLVAAVINARGKLTRRLTYEFHGSGEDQTIIVSGTLRGEAEPRVVDVVLKNVKTANVQWVKQPDQQLMYHGARKWARRHTPELMLGVYSPEEFDDKPEPAAPVKPKRARRVIMVPPAPSSEAPLPAAQEPAAPAPQPQPPQDAGAAVDFDAAVPTGQQPNFDLSKGVAFADALKADQHMAVTAMNGGTAALRPAWVALPPAMRWCLRHEKESRYKKMAFDADIELINRQAEAARQPSGKLTPPV